MSGMKNHSTSPVPPNTPFTAAELAILRARYPHELTRIIAADLGRSVFSLYNRAYALGLKKSDAFFAGGNAGRADGARGLTTRFIKGDAPWNKGAHFVAGGRSAQTRFKPGQKPSNTHAIGSYRITKDGTLQRKIGDKNGNNSQRWRGVHELVWVAANGPLPPKHIVVFKKGMRSNQLADITIDRVECISLAENMRRNTVHNLPKTLANLVQLTGALNRKINDRQRKQRQRTE